MSELRLFTITASKVQEWPPKAYKLEREVQNLFEANLEALLSVRFVASEYSTGQGGRIDTLGIDENGFPVVIEYKLDKNRTVINQGMSYMAWLRSHKAEFWKVVFERLGKEVADSIDHSSIRLICIATDFTRDDLGAYELMPSNIDLVRYRRFGDDHLILERVQSSDETPISTPIAKGGGNTSGTSTGDKPITQILADADPQTQRLYEAIRELLLSQGEDVTEKATKLYFAFKRTRNFASVVNGRRGEWLLQLHLDPDTVELRPNIRDVRKIGIWGTGQLQIRLTSVAELQEVAPLVQRAYEGQS
jgi:predicted transport protein